MDTASLIDRVDLRSLAEAAGARFPHGGRGNTSHCPLHGGDNPDAFHLYRGKGGRWRWHCFTRCPQGQNDGDAIGFYMRWKRVDFATAVRELTGPRRVTKMHKGPERHKETEGYGASAMNAPCSSDSLCCFVPLRGSVAPSAPSLWQARAAAFVSYAQRVLWSPAGAAALRYLREARGLNDDTIRAWGLGYCPEDWRDEPARWGLEGGKVWCPRGIVIPAYRAGALRHVKVRRPLPGDALGVALGVAPGREPGPKYAGLRGGQAALYGEERMRGLPDLLLVEGEFDALLAWQEARGLLDVATLGGALQGDDDWSALSLSYARRIFVAYDADAAGSNGARRFCATSSKSVQVALPAVGAAQPKDVTEFWRAGGDLRAWLASLLIA